jgi:hypothetical protein
VTLEIGTRLGPYHVVSAIGAGGPPPLALSTVRARYGEVSPKPSMRTR